MSDFHWHNSVTDGGGRQGKQLDLTNADILVGPFQLHPHGLAFCVQREVQEFPATVRGVQLHLEKEAKEEGPYCSTTEVSHLHK